MFRSVADLLDATPLERELYDENTALKDEARKHAQGEELRDEQLDWALEAVLDVVDLAARSKHLRVGELRAELAELVANIRCDY